MKPAFVFLVCIVATAAASSIPLDSGAIMPMDVCGNTYTDPTGYVKSPNHPDPYGNNQNCSSVIRASTQSTFNLYFSYFALEDDCNHDWLEVTCLDNSDGPSRYCGTIDSFSHYFYGCSEVLLWFHSDGSDNDYPGFNIYYQFYEGNTQSPATAISTTLPTTRSTPGGPQSTPTPSVECGKTSYNGQTGVINSPNHPGDYPNNIYCDYFIDASSSSSSIAIIFQAFDTQQGVDYVTISCPTNFSYPSLRYSGASLPRPFSIPWCSQGSVNFITDGSLVSTGFSLDYHVSFGGCGDTVYSGSHGYVSSPNYPNNYGLNQNCSNIIGANQRSSFSITFQYMNVEACCDFVELSCLDNAASGSYRYTGTSIPPKLDIPECTHLLVWFYSDDTVVLNGFNLEYIVTSDSGQLW